MDEARLQPTFQCLDCDDARRAEVHDVAPVQTLPVPRAALDGFPEGREPSVLTRRRLLKGGLAGFAAVYGGRALGFEEAWETAAAQAAPSDSNVLVLIFLQGGSDGLNTLIPTEDAQYAAYQAARAQIHRLRGPAAGGRVGSVALPGGAPFALAEPCVSGTNSGAVGLDTLWGTGLGDPTSKLALLPAVDVPQYSFSHFENSDFWFSGTRAPMTTGWLGRWIDRYGTATNPLQAVSLSKAIRTRDKPVCAMTSLDSLGFAMNRGYDSPGGAPGAVNAEVDALAAVGGGSTALARARATYGYAVDAQQARPSVPTDVSAAPYPSSGQLQRQLRLAAQLVAANLGTRIITVHWGSFDTHGGQLTPGTGQDSQLMELSRCLAAFDADLTTRGVADRVATVAFTEFGRRVDENASVGTDHGTGGLLLASGPGVRGGMAGEFPGCRPTDLRNGGNLQVSTDYRSVYAAVLEEWLGGDANEILGFDAPALVRPDGWSSLFR